MNFKYDSKELTEEFEKAFKEFGEYFNTNFKDKIESAKEVKERLKKEVKQETNNLKSFFEINGKSNVIHREDLNLLYIEIVALGMNKQDITVNLKDNILEVIGECSVDGCTNDKYLREEFMFNSFKKYFKIDKNYVDGDFEITLENGMLNIAITKLEKKEINKQFKVN